MRHRAFDNLRILGLSGILLIAIQGVFARDMKESEMNELVGQPADIASSAYQYRADRKADENPPESWLALMHFAKQPLNKPADVNAPAIKQVLCALLWEEVRPVQQLELTWSRDAKNVPAPEEVIITTLDNQGAASSWWNNLGAAQKQVRPDLSNDGRNRVYGLNAATCGIVISVPAGKSASDYSVPTVRVLVADTWKKMNVEVEWGYDKTTTGKDYSGNIETYDGAVIGLKPLDGNSGTTASDARSWRSPGTSSTRRGMKFSLLYMGTSEWREVQPFTSQRDDVARTIVTLWTQSGNFSFLAADLENGPILAPEYGFFVRRVSEWVVAAPKEPYPGHISLANKMDTIAGTAELQGWGSDDTPWFGGNPSDKPVSVQGINVPAKNLAMHPGADCNVAVGWRSPINGKITIKAGVTHAQSGGNGIEWRLAHEYKTKRNDLAHGTTEGTASQAASADRQADIEPGDMISLLVGPKGAHQADTTIIGLVITEVGGKSRTWNVTDDVVKTIHAGNPHADSQGNTDTWHFYSYKQSMSQAGVAPTLASKATNAQNFIKELQDKKLSAIRQQIRVHTEQTWEDAVTGLNGNNLPPHPKPPAGSEPSMQVEVPSERLTAQWNLGAWHLVRHCAKNPTTGKLWFNDYPYGILGAETYMILAALDLMGSHQAAEDGFDQWVSLPMDPNSAGHHEWALPDRPNGLFSEGHGCMTHAVGPNGIGGQMDGVHAFGPGSIGWALTEHYWLTGDRKWLEAAAPRIKANAEWMMRQRRVMSSVMPGGERLWCKGLQPALQVTPDSGGLWMQFYECEGYYWASIARLAPTLAVVDPEGGAKLAVEAEAYRQDLRAAVERSIARSPVVPVRDGTYHSVIPFGCYVRGLGTGAWGWQRDGSGNHVGPLYWETVQSAAALISPAGLLPADDVRVQGYLDVLEDRLLLENEYVRGRSKGNWFLAGWQYQGGLERTANMHLAGDDIPVFIRSFMNCYAVDILPNDGYIFNEHAVHGPPDKIYEEAAFLERFRNLLVMEDEQNLWLARGTPRTWLQQGKKISVKNAPTHFGTVDYAIVSDADHGRITATVKMPSRHTTGNVLLRLRHPKTAPIKSVSVNGAAWRDFDVAKEVVNLHDLAKTVKVEVIYTP